MGYDNSSVTGDEICDYYYDIENNLINPESPSGYFIYKILGGCFDWLNDLIAQFRIDFSILDCDVGSVEIVSVFPEEPDTSHVYYVCTDDGLIRYSYDGSEWVSERFSGDVLNSLDVFWGRSYNLLRPLLYEGIHREYLFEDACTLTDNKSDNYVSTTGSYSFDGEGLTIDASTFSSSNYQANLRLDDSNLYTVPFTVEFDLINAGNDLFTLNFHNDSYSNQSVVAANLWDDPQGEVTHIKFNVTENQITRTINGRTSNLNPSSVSNKVGVRFGYWRTTQSQIKIKNYKVYRGDEKERPLTDEEYKIYLYLKNHQLLTMKDLLVAFTNAFGDAETTTTVLNSIHTVDHKKYDDPSFSNDTLTAYDNTDTDIITDKITDKSGVDVINDRLAQGTTTIQIPDNDWDEEFLTLLEEFISIKGNILISQGG